MLFPISDDDRHLMRPAYVSITLLLINVAVFLYQLDNTAFTIGWSVIPAEITSGTDFVGPHYIGEQVIQNRIDHVPGPSPIYLTLLSSMLDLKRESSLAVRFSQLEECEVEHAR